MKTLDLHGIKHEKVDRIVENFVLLERLPCRIITGNSPTMRGLVEEVLRRYNLHACVENDWNLGSLIIKEQC